MATKLEALVGGIITGRWRSQCLYAGVKLGIFDIMSTTKPKAIADIAKEAEVDRDMSYRLLRALARRLGRNPTLLQNEEEPDQN
jgi:hypothetical protein